MADNCLLFSENVACDTQQQVEWLVARLHNYTDEDGENRSPCDFEPNSPEEELGVWLYSEEYPSSLEGLIEVLQEFQEHFQKHDPIIISWAYTCSKPRIAEFGGGAVRIQNGDTKWVDARTEAELAGQRNAITFNAKERKLLDGILFKLHNEYTVTYWEEEDQKAFYSLHGKVKKGMVVVAQ